MMNSLFMLGSFFNKNRKVSIDFMVGWVIYIIINQLYLGLFPMINVIVFLVVTISINLIKIKRVNTVLSVFSIIIWIAIIDEICYYMYFHQIKIYLDMYGKEYYLIINIFFLMQ